MQKESSLRNHLGDRVSLDTTSSEEFIQELRILNEFLNQDLDSLNYYSRVLKSRRVSFADV
eukprot:snap_masked-scaffold_1-processed-gene-10.10-mRNA-1 protein AED:1.00 eAED:1.00 QI:0/0/0/0/1/1/2/0/60